MKNKLTTLIQDVFHPTHLVVQDDSAKHKGHREGGADHGTHFCITIVSGAFEGLPKVARHRAVYACTHEAFNDTLHALQLTLLTPAEAAVRS